MGQASELPRERPSDIGPQPQRRPAEEGDRMESQRIAEHRLNSMFRQDTEAMIDLLHLVVGRLQRGESVSSSIDQAFRYAHSIRSEASFLQYGTVVESARELESVLRGCRARGSVSAEDVEALRNGIVGLEYAFASLSQMEGTDGKPKTAGSGSLLDIPLDQRRLRLLRDSRLRGEKLYLVRCRIAEIPEMLAPRLYLVVGNLEKATHVLDTLPRLDESAGDSDVLEALCTVPGGEDPIRRALMVDAVEDVEIQALEYAEVDAQARGGDATAGQYPISRVSVGIDTREYEQLCLHADELSYQLRELRTRDAEKLKQLSRESQLRLTLSERLAAALGRTVYANSHISAHELLEPLPTIVRRLARDTGKQVTAQLSCEDVSLFLPVADVLRDAILHLVRNAVDHGIEPSAERLAAGKPETGVITVSIRHDGTNAEISVADDGRGLPDPQPGRSLWETVSAPGFSSAAPDAQVSGEGVGLDVVRYSVERIIGGSVELESRRRSGTRFRLRIPTGDRPLTVLVIEANGKNIAIPAAYVYDVVEIDRDRVAHAADGALEYPYAGENVPLRSLHAGGITDTGGALHGVLMQVGSSRQLIVVHSVAGTETVLRDAAARDRVFSQGVDRSIPLFLPLRYL